MCATLSSESDSNANTASNNDSDDTDDNDNISNLSLRQHKTIWSCLEDLTAQQPSLFGVGFGNSIAWTGWC